MIVQASDGEFTVAETVSVYLLNQISGGPIDTISGRNNCMDLSVLVHQPEYLTGHTYELRFLQYRALNYYPEYIYEIRDSNTNAVVLDTYSLKDGYIYIGSRVKIMDFSPIIDGFSIEAFLVMIGSPNRTFAMTLWRSLLEITLLIQSFYGAVQVPPGGHTGVHVCSWIGF